MLPATMRRSVGGDLHDLPKYKTCSSMIADANQKLAATQDGVKTGGCVILFAEW